jgi:hypothetical protein
LRKISIILFVGILLSGCSVTRKSRNIKYSGSSLNGSENISRDLIVQNISSRSFYIQKAEVELINENIKQKFLASIKFEWPDKYLISLKTRTGIEGARIYVTKDSVFVNDRIHKKMYLGRAAYFKRKYGLNQSFLPLIFGDVLIEGKLDSSRIRCLEDKLKFNCAFKGVRINYNLECTKGKTTLTVLETNYMKENISIRYDKFINIGGILIPKTVDINDLQMNTEIRIKLFKVEFPWSGNINFIPGKGYELIELL